MSWFDEHQSLPNDEWFQALKDDNIEDYMEYLWFDLDGVKFAEFKSTVAALESDTTLSTAQLVQWETQHLLFIGQSIDSDYLVCDQQATYVIPYDLHTADIERFDLSIASFMAQWTSHQLESRYLIAE